MTKQSEATDNNGPQRVWIRWGSGEGTALSAYEFATIEELNAFLLGVDESSGWMDYEQFDQAPVTLEETVDEETN